MKEMFSWLNSLFGVSLLGYLIGFVIVGCPSIFVYCPIRALQSCI